MHIGRKKIGNAVTEKELENLWEEGYVMPVAKKKIYLEERYVLMDTLYLQNTFILAKFSNSYLD